MKFISIDSIFLLSSVTIAFGAELGSVVDTAIVFENEPLEREAMFKVEIDIDCKGVHFDKLSLKALGYSSLALQESYNKVHNETDNGDGFLVHTHFDHVSKKTDIAEGELGMLGKYRPTVYIGGWGCNFCPEDDDSSFLMVGDSGVALHAWESELTSAFVASPHKELAKAKSCKILAKVRPEAMVESGVEAAIVSKKPKKHSEEDALFKVDIGIDCKGVHFDKLSLKALGFSSTALQESYNTVHEETDNGDSFLVGTHFDHVSKKADASGLRGMLDVAEGELGMLGKYRPTVYIGGWGCNFCPEDDDSSFLMVGGSGVALRAWESAFATALKESPHKELAKAKSCKILAKAKPSAVLATA
jgi:hypothetical protein